MDKPRVRLTTGKLKGRWLALPDNAAVRPTRDRVRQAAFNMLESRIDFHNLTVLDLCCGSGAWGLEAFSRGAKDVWLMDTDTRTVEANVKALGSPAGVHVVRADAASWQPSAPANLVLADPPYGSKLATALLRRAAQFGKSQSLWAVEHGREETFDWQGFTVETRKDYGISTITLARFL